jgi:hypothetical protein
MLQLLPFRKLYKIHRFIRQGTFTGSGGAQKDKFHLSLLFFAVPVIISQKKSF